MNNSMLVKNETCRRGALIIASAIFVFAATIMVNPAPSFSAEILSDGLTPEQAGLLDRVQQKFMCLCGCGSTVKDCPHIECGFAIPFRKQLKGWVTEGKDEKGIIESAVAQDGTRVLAAPPAEGFNIVGWVAPFLTIIIAGVVVARIVIRWTKSGTAEDEQLRKKFESSIAGKDKKYLDEIERELDEKD